MKRSDAVAQLHSELQDLRGQAARYSISSWQLAEAVIDFCTMKIKMEPPKRVEKSVLPGVNDFLVNKWEDEK